MLGFAVYAENRQLPVNWHLEKMPKPVKYTLETARALYFASLVAAPVILEKMVKGELVEPVSAGLVLGTAGAGLLYSWLRIGATNNIGAREWRKEALHSREIDLKVNDWVWQRMTNDDTSQRLENIKKGAGRINQDVEVQAGKLEKERVQVSLFSLRREVPISGRLIQPVKPKWQLDLKRRLSWSQEQYKGKQ